MGSGKNVVAGKASEGWYSHSNAATTMVFVHGVMSDQDSAWRGAAFWPDLVRSDERLPIMNIYLAAYHTSLSSGSYGITACARELLEALTIPSGQHAPVMDSDEIVFICHSMGGLVVRTMLTDNTHRFAAKKIGLVLMASPSMGSQYARWLAPLAGIIGHAQALGLQPDAEGLEALDDRFRQMHHEKRIPRLIGAEAHEHLGPVKTLLGRIFSKPIVPPESASRYFGSPNPLPGTSHSTIVKPRDYDAPGHRFLVRYLLEDYGLSPRDRAQPSPSVVDGAVVKVSQVLFDSLDKNSLAYYLRRKDDDRLSSSMAQFSVWLVGPSGVGKTSAARAQILATGYPVVELCLSAYAGKMSVDGCIDELAYVLEQRANASIGSVSRTEQAVFREIARLAENASLILYFDEVPLSGEPAALVDEFTGFVVRLLNYVKDQKHCPGFRILLSSVAAPGELMVLDGKARERLKVIDLALWDDASLAELLALVLPPLRQAAPGFSADPEQVISQSVGLPRELKNLLRESIALESRGTGTSPSQRV